MAETITLVNPFDAHVHVRQNDMLRQVLPLTMYSFAGALLMPNTSPPIDSRETLDQYVDKVYEEIDSRSMVSFNPWFTLYFRTDYERSFLEWAKDKILGIKFYPKGMTTNSDHGCDPHDIKILEVLSIMEELDIPLCVHAEYKGFVLQREHAFSFFLEQWTRTFPNLRIVLEHMSDGCSASLLKHNKNIYATITPHHLMVTLDDVIGDKLNPHLFCKPIPKYPADRAMLNELAWGNNHGWSNWDHVKHKVMLGTDSAPHYRIQKESECGCAGVFTAPIALQLVVQQAMIMGCSTERLQAFVSGNAEKFYGLKFPGKKTVILEKTPFVVPSEYNSVVPMWAKKTLDWTIKSVSD